EVELGATLGVAMDAALVGLAELGALGLQHCLFLSPLSSAGRTDAGSLGFHHQPFLRHRVVAEDLALEDPYLDAAGPVGGLRGRLGIIDVGAKRVQRHPALAIAFRARDLGAAETAAADDANALGAKTHRGLHRALH